MIEEQWLTDLLQRDPSNKQRLELLSNRHLRRREVVQIGVLADHLKSTKKAKEKLQRKVDDALTKMDDLATPSYSRMTHRSTRLTAGSLIKHPPSTNSNPVVQSPSPDLRSLRHHYLQAKIPRHQLPLLVEQGGWHQRVYLEFKRELDIIDSDNALDLIRYITSQISLLLKENGSVAEPVLVKHFDEHRILFLADFQLLLTRFGMVALEDLTDLLMISRLAKASEVGSYAKNVFCLNVNRDDLFTIYFVLFLLRSRSTNSWRYPKRMKTFWSNSSMCKIISRRSCASMLTISLNCWIMFLNLIDWSESSTSFRRLKRISVYIPSIHSMLSKPCN